MQEQALWMRLRDEKWDDYEVSSGKAQRLDKVLQDLASRKKARSMRACHEVWKLLCSGGVHSATVITVPYLMEIIWISSPDVQMEIADILRDCAAGVPRCEEDWAGDLSKILISLLPAMARFKKRAKGDLDIACAGCMDAIAFLKL